MKHEILDIPIYKILENSLKDIIGEGKVFPCFGVDEKPPFITYTVTPISENHIIQSQIEIKSVSQSRLEALKLICEIDKILSMDEDEPTKTMEGINFFSSSAGGGCLYNDSINMWEVNKIYIMKWRSL